MNISLIAPILLLLITSVFLVLYILIFVDQFMGHGLPTSKRATDQIIVAVRQHKPNAKNFYDLGCARGRLALNIKKHFPNLEVIAIDNSRLRLFFARMKALFLRRKINFVKNNVLKQNLSGADVVFAYLWYNWLPPLEEKLQKELKKGSVVITNTSHFPSWVPTKTIVLNPDNPEFEKLFVYIK